MMKWHVLFCQMLMFLLYFNKFALNQILFFSFLDEKGLKFINYTFQKTDVIMFSANSRRSYLDLYHHSALLFLLFFGLSSTLINPCFIHSYKPTWTCYCIKVPNTSCQYIFVYQKSECWSRIILWQIFMIFDQISVFCRNYF